MKKKIIKQEQVISVRFDYFHNEKTKIGFGTKSVNAKNDLGIWKISQKKGDNWEGIGELPGGQTAEELIDCVNTFFNGKKSFIFNYS
ncbi:MULTISPECIES: hypothetical protein [unclassified Rhodanobacter]|uniref:Uncharacterized protein n=1 Tax=Rhodanobacter humi TaxID=1888173 RepID=A0ABV4ANQ2_9GAMM